MSGIAKILTSRGISVSGCDAKESRRTAALRAIGIRVEIGHAPAHISGVDSVIVSTAISKDNSEPLGAKDLGIPVLSRAEALGAIMSGFFGIAITGTHGKTTTTSMFTIALQNCGADPSFAIGGELNGSGANAHFGTGELFVVEADESDGAFLFLQPQVAIVTNIEVDHLDHWGTYEAIEQAFVDFALGVGERKGFVVTCRDDPGSLRMALAAQQLGVDIRTYGESADADYRMIDAKPSSTGWSFDTVFSGVRQGEIHLQVPGHHNALNALAVYAAMLSMGYPAQQVVQGLEQFSGTRRRFEFKGEVNGIRVFDDYAHHPTEIIATLRAAREVAGKGRLIVAFQPHRYSRTALFQKEFGDSLGLADRVVILEVFSAGEDPIPGASGQTMAQDVPLPSDCVVFEPSLSHVANHLIQDAQQGDVIITLGAGDIGLIANEVIDRLRDQRELRGVEKP